VNWQLASNVTFTWKQPHEVDCADTDNEPKSKKAKTTKQRLVILVSALVKVIFTIRLQFEKS
jgi:hypothetical protein